jgi:hypothetical protein
MSPQNTHWCHERVDCEIVALPKGNWSEFPGGLHPAFTPFHSMCRFAYAHLSAPAFSTTFTLSNLPDSSSPSRIR